MTEEQRRHVGRQSLARGFADLAAAAALLVVNDL
jgi:hypothetical protein